MSSVTETFLKCSLNVNVGYSKDKYGKWKRVGILPNKQLTRNIFVARIKLSCDSDKSEFPMNCVKKLKDKLLSNPYQYNSKSVSFK